MQAMTVQYEFRQEPPDVTVGIVAGQLNLGNRRMELEHNLKQRIAEGSRKMVLDLSGVTSIDSQPLSRLHGATLLA